MILHVLFIKIIIRKEHYFNEMLSLKQSSEVKRIKLGYKQTTP